MKALNIDWQISPDEHLIIVTTGENLNAGDLHAYRAEVLMSGRYPGCRQLIDITSLDCSRLIYMDLMDEFVACMNHSRNHLQGDRAALVAATSSQQGMAAFLRSAFALSQQEQAESPAALLMDVGVFTDIQQARTWLTSDRSESCQACR
ncbi:MAG: hypothetical protein KDI36_17085 [Pseudomonadales bacterium]|nr:hypothetical protein [Pseudomonadales bacterium]